MLISVASGKGGTGKTLIATSLALALKDYNRVRILDCDVEEPNDQILLKPVITGEAPVNVLMPEINEAKCSHCGICARVCAYHAIVVLDKQVLTFPQLCHGCGACTYLCPEKAIKEVPRETGIVQWGNADQLSFAQGILTIGEAMTPPVIRQLKTCSTSDDIIIRDVPPGTSCPVVESVKGSDYCLLVTEPTPFGLNDLTLAVEMIKTLGIPCGVIINRSGKNDASLEEYCEKEGIPVLLKIPLDMDIARAYSLGTPMVKAQPQWKNRFRQLYENIQRTLIERNRYSQR